ncbi:MAG: hypothetical protein K8953_01375, partial [Proteobacteria bacterium]|nr:hypothetical protein [Pseudomonadota bacterium]
FGTGNAPPTQAATTTETITATARFLRSTGQSIARNAQGEVLASDGSTVLTYTDEITKNAGGEKHANGDPIIFTTTTKFTIPAPPSGRERTTAYDADGNVIPDVRASSSKYDAGSEIDILKRVTLTESERSYITENAMFTDEVFKKRTTSYTVTEGVRNQFLQGVDALGGRLDEGPAGVVHSRGSLNLASSTFGGKRLGGDFADGVGFFRGFTPENPIYAETELGYPEIKRHNYAGIYSGTNLGAPVSGTGTASWNGRIRTIGYFEFDTDFTLRVTFGTGNTGTLNVARLENPKNTNQFLMITNATYDANGVISGEIVIDEDNDLQNIQAQHGFLTGLIGEQGAVAAFLSSGDRNGDNTEAIGTKESITQGFHELGFAGGFVAHPTATAAPVAPPNLNVRINAWTSSFTNTLPGNVKRRTRNDAEPSNAFLLRDDPAKRPSWKKPEGGFLALSALGGDTTDGVDFLPADITIINVRSTRYTTRTQRTYHAGLWDSTDLGAAISLSTNFNNQPSAMWNGKFSVFQGANARFDTDFTFAVDFVNNSFSATINDTDANNDYYLSGSYTADGVMVGQVNHSEDASDLTTKNGILTGLIGSDGAVAAFVSNDDDTDKNTIDGGTGATGFAGGFVARPGPLLSAVVDVTDLPNYADIPTTFQERLNTGIRNGKFLRIEDHKNINTAGLANPVTFTQRRDNTADSEGFGDGYTIINPHGYAAILPTTNLGLPRAVGSGEPTVIWNGTYSLIRAHADNPNLATNAPITFLIDFETGDLTGTGTSNPSDNIAIYTTFDANGVITGTFSTNGASN